MNHPSDDELRALTLGQLTTADSIRVQRHVFYCHEPCLHRLIELEVDLQERDLRHPPFAVEHDRRSPLFIRHDTADGLVYMRVERRGRRWFTRHWGDQLDGGRECRTMREANEAAVTDFQAMFPEHRCTARCCANPQSSK